MKKFIDEFKNLIESSEAKLRSIGEEKSALKFSPNIWSSKEILGHLVRRGEISNSTQITRIQKIYTDFDLCGSA